MEEKEKKDNLEREIERSKVKKERAVKLKSGL